MKLVWLVLIYVSFVVCQCNPTCKNGGTCLPGGSCDCKTDTTGWAGPTCEEPLCDNGGCGPGRCVKPNTCDCSNTGFTGTRCEKGVCTTPCKNNGVCVGPEACSCDTEKWAGQYCEVPVCNPVCKAGSCVAPNVCNCTGTGFDGPLCEQFTCETPCAHGSCVGPNLCSCNGTSYVGALCEIPVCTPPCESGGKCTSPGVCDCTGTGWKGELCEIPICDTVKCLNGGNCSGHNVCDCRGTGYIGEVCDMDTDECMATPPPCDPLTTCENTIGSYNCSDCPSGWSGNGRQKCIPICNQKCMYGNCTKPDYCTCDPGFEGVVCSLDIDECAVGGYCSPLVNCTNSYGSFACGPCPGNYTGDGYHCDPPCGEGFYCAEPFVCMESIANVVKSVPLIVLVAMMLYMNFV